MTLSLSLPAWEIATRLAQATCIPSSMKSSQAKALLVGMRFDQAPVMRGRRLTGWVLATHLVSRGYVDARTKPLDECLILARDTPVSSAIAALANQRLVFLAGPEGICEFIVASDLDRHAVRCYLYVLFSELEMRMADLAEAALSAERLRNAINTEKKRYRDAVDRDVDTRVVEYLNFSAYEKLAPEVPGIVAAFRGNSDDITRNLRRLTKLRNHVAHPTKPIAVMFDPPELAELTALAESALVRLRSTGVG